jgi:hypothetical protein
MSKFEQVDIMRETFGNYELVDMFTYWLDQTEIEKCIEDFLNDRDLEIKNNTIVQRKY